MADPIPTPAPSSQDGRAPTPSAGTRRPLPTLDLLEQAKGKDELSSSDVLRLSPEDYRIVTQERLKNAEALGAETADAVHDLRRDMVGYRAELETKSAEFRALVEEKASEFRRELLAHVTPLKLRVAGLAGLAVVGSAVGGALLTHLFNLLLHALSR